MTTPQSPKPIAKQSFVYQATTARGQRTKGIIEANNIALAKAMLYKQGLSQITLKPAPVALFRYQRPIGMTQALLSLQTLATLIGSGIVLTQALTIASTSTTNQRLSAYLAALKSDIESGYSFAQALSRQPLVFGALAVSLIDAGEKSGTLDVMLERIVSHLQKQLWLKARINKALHYPCIVLFVAIVVMAILLIKVVPSFAATFASMGATLPVPTQIVMSISEFLVLYFWPLLGALVVLGIGAFYLYKKSARTRQAIATYSLKLPIIGQLIRLSASAQFSRTLATTFGAGVPLTDALALSAKATNHPLYIQSTDQIIQQVRTGTSLHTAIMQTQLFSSMSVQMIGIGEESGKLVEMLDKVADYHEQQVDARVDTLTGLIEPVMIIILGIMIGGLVLAMYLPMFNLGAIV